MQGCLPARFGLLDLVFSLGGTFTFLLDLGADVWGAVEYSRSGDGAWAALLLGFYGLSSLVLQLFSWCWFWVDRRNDETGDSRSDSSRGGAGCPGHQASDTSGGVEAKSGRCGNGAAGAKTTEGREGSAGSRQELHVERGEEDGEGEALNGTANYGGSPSAGPGGGEGGDPGDLKVVPGEAGTGHTEDTTREAGTGHPGDVMPGEAGTGHPGDVMPGDAGTGHHKDNMPRNACTGHPKYFCTSRLLNCTPCLAILHILQLGYPLRCIHSVEAGLSAFRCKEGTSNSAWLQEYAYFLTHDISMMRLMETFLENSPQLILLLYIVLQRGEIQYFQYFSISSSFLSISWSIVDYHRSLRLFLKDKQKLNICSSAVYFLWNFFLILPRILCITLFASVFHCWIALHFLMLWVPFFLWVWLQKTDFMQRKQLEHIYRATVAVVLYFSWFNIADGRTIHRCLIYHIFITTDSLVLLISWKYLRFPSIVDYYEMPLFLVVLTAFFLGLLLRWFYYTLLHPNLGSESRNSNDEPDFRMRGAGTVEFKGLMLKRRPAGFRNPRMLLLSRNMY